MSKTLDIASFIERSRCVPVLDVRAPGRVREGPYPRRAQSAAVFERRTPEIGTLYEQAGREAAALRGLDFVGPKRRRMVEAAQALVTGDEVPVHCWRGGMRSESVWRNLIFS